MIETIKKRRSIRSYKDAPLKEDHLNTILEAAIYAPSGMNYQTWHFTAILNAEKIVEIGRAHV